MVIDTLQVCDDGDFRTGGEVCDGIVNRDDLLEEIQDFWAVVPLPCEVIVPIDATSADGLRHVAGKQRNAFLRICGVSVAVLGLLDAPKVCAGVRLDNAELLVEGIGGHKTARQL